MNDIAVYDPAIVERGMDTMTDQIITRVNIHHDVVKIAKRIHHREATLKRRINTAENKLRRERKKAKIRARWNGVCYSLMLGAAAWFAHIALTSGLLNIDFTVPLTAASVALLSWTMCGWWHDIRRKKD